MGKKIGDQIFQWPFSLGQLNPKEKALSIAFSQGKKNI
jgi:hypothetical protein